MLKQLINSDFYIDVNGIYTIIIVLFISLYLYYIYCRF